MATPGAFDPFAAVPLTDELSGVPLGTGGPWEPGAPPPWLVPPAPPAVAPAVADAAAAPAPDAGLAAPAAAPPGVPPPVADELGGAPPLPAAITEPAPAADPAAFAGLTAPTGPAAPLPDAITGAGGMPATGSIDGVPYAATLTPEQHYAQTVAGFGPGGDPFDAEGKLTSGDDAERQRYLNELAMRDPAKFAEIVQRRADAKATRFAARQLELSNRDFDTQQANLRAKQEADKVSNAKVDTLLADSQRIADTKIDPAGGVHGARLVAGVIASIIGGLYQARHGGSNMGLDALNATIARGIDAQKADLANQREGIGVRRSILAEEMRRHGDAYQAAETLRLAALKHADDLLAIEQQNYDPRGTTALKIAGVRAGIAAQKEQAVAAYKQKAFENDLKYQDAKRQQQLADETVRHNRQQIGLGYAQLASAAADRKEARDARASDKALERADKEAERDRQFAVGGVPHVAVGPDGKPVIGPDGKPVVSRDVLRNADGTTWHAPSPEREKEISEKTVATRQLTKLYDRALALRDRVGGESKVFNSDEYQELKSIEAEIKILRKQGTQGMSSDADMENLAEAGGARDLTSFRAKAAGLMAARARIVDNLNETYRAAKYTGPDLTFPPPTATNNTPEENRTQALLQKSGGTFEDELRTKLDRAVAARGYPIDTSDPADQQLYQQAVAETRATFDPEASADQRAELQRLGQAAAGKGEAATRAREDLTKIARMSNSARLRELAQQELDVAVPKPTPRGPTSEGVVVPDALRLQ